MFEEFKERFEHCYVGDSDVVFIGEDTDMDIEIDGYYVDINERDLDTYKEGDEVGDAFELAVVLQFMSGKLKKIW